MAVTSFRQLSMDDTQPEVLLLRNVLATAAHDLGGLASALQLRADVLEHGSSEASVRAMRSISAELRALGQHLRAIRNDGDQGALAPAHQASTLSWSARVTRFGIGLLPRGSAIECTVDDAGIPHALAHSLWSVSLGLLGAIASCWPDTRVHVHVNSEQRSNGITLTLGATADGAELELADAMQGRWWQWALLQASKHQITLSAEGKQVMIAAHTSAEA